MYAPDGSRLCKLNLRTRQVTVLLDDPQGGIRDPRVHYDGGKILFSYRKGGTQYYHLYEINADGSGLRQLTSGDWDDVDPAYLPDGGIVFVVEPLQAVRALLPRAGGDHSTAWTRTAATSCAFPRTTCCDDRPAVLPDGRVVYTRWEYVDRAAEKFRDLWIMNPDGTGQMVLFGGTARPYPAVLREVRRPADPRHGRQVVAVFSPAHGHRENAGNVMVVDLKAGPDDWSAARQISPELPNLEWTHRLGARAGRIPRSLPARPRTASWSPRTRAC